MSQLFSGKDSLGSAVIIFAKSIATVLENNDKICMQCPQIRKFLLTLHSTQRNI